jgi:hypothetical protein
MKDPVIEGGVLTPEEDIPSPGPHLDPELPTSQLPRMSVPWYYRFALWCRKGKVSSIAVEILCFLISLLTPAGKAAEPLLNRLKELVKKWEGIKVSDVDVEEMPAKSKTILLIVSGIFVILVIAVVLLIKFT